VLNHRQLAILAHLSGFGRDLEGTWDVPRELSLVGIAERLGVVRSALNPPLKALQEAGHVTIRTAHVVGSNRRRKVVHITQSGRDVSDSIESRKPKRRLPIGPIPNPVKLSGRDDDISSIVGKISKGKSILLEGLPGIGKTSLAVAVCEALSSEGWTVRWATCHPDSDSRSVASMWLGRSSPSSIESISAKVDSKKALLVLDEAQQISDRHLGAIRALIESCSETSSSVLIVARAPNPLVGMAGFVEQRLEGLNPEDAVYLLPEDLDEQVAMDVCEAMAGHPLGLKLWSPEDELPGSGAVQEYVENTVLRRLSEEGTSSLDELSLSPLALRLDELFEPEGADELDDSAILRWSGDEIEPHHLVRNVRRAAWSEEEISQMHTEQAQKWSTRDGPRALRIEAHHRLSSGNEASPDWILEKVPAISSDDSSAAAVVLEQAMGMIEDEGLFAMAADVALERGETEIAHAHIGSLQDGPSRQIRESRLARMEGNYSKADQLEGSAISAMSPGDRVRAQISSLVRKFDDRLPGPIETGLAKTVFEGASSVDLSELSSADSELAGLALDLLRHSIALETGNLEEAARTRDSLEERMGPDDSRITSLDLRARLMARSEGGPSAEAMGAARQHIESSLTPMESIRTIHLALDASSPNHPTWLMEAHSSFPPDSLRGDLASHRRACSHWWFWRGALEPKNRLSCWKEAIARLRTAECGEAAKELIRRLSNEL